MSSALARQWQTDLPLRKPPACEPRGAEPPRSEIVRQAFGADVVGSSLSPRAQLGYRVLVDHVNRGRDPRRPYDGQVFLTDETFANELGGVSKRQVQRIRSELLMGGWIVCPKETQAAGATPPSGITCIPMAAPVAFQLDAAEAACGSRPSQPAPGGDTAITARRQRQKG